MDKSNVLDYPEDAVTIAIDRQLGNCWLKEGNRCKIDVEEKEYFYSRIESFYDPVEMIESAIDQKHHFEEWYLDRYIPKNGNGNNGGKVK